MNVKTHKGSIFDVQADVIVNPANCFLRHGGGLARLIHDIAGGLDDHGYDRHPWTLQQERARLTEYHDFCGSGHRVPTGDCLIGPPGLLDYKAIAHAVGPIWKDGTLYEPELLMLAYANTLRAVQDAGYHSVVFPAISAGIFGAPIHDVANAAWKALRFHAYYEIEVTFALTDDYHYAVFESTLGDLLTR